MPLHRGKSTEQTKLQTTVNDLPKKVADWTPAQRQAYATQSDRAMREQAGVDPNTRP